MFNKEIEDLKNKQTKMNNTIEDHMLLNCTSHVEPSAGPQRPDARFRDIQVPYYEQHEYSSPRLCSAPWGCCVTGAV